MHIYLPTILKNGGIRMCYGIHCDIRTSCHHHWLWLLIPDRISVISSELLHPHTDRKTAVMRSPVSRKVSHWGGEIMYDSKCLWIVHTSGLENNQVSMFHFWYVYCVLCFLIDGDCFIFRSH